MGFVAFALFSMTVGLSARNETGTAFTREILSDRSQLALFGFALLLTYLPTKLPFLQQLLGLTDLTGQHWLQIIVVAFILLLIQEVIKYFLRQQRSKDAPVPAATAPEKASA
jgi:Ca2+-transporting ATPase